MADKSRHFDVGGGGVVVAVMMMMVMMLVTFRHHLSHYWRLEQACGYILGLYPDNSVTRNPNDERNAMYLLPRYMVMSPMLAQCSPLSRIFLGDSLTPLKWETYLPDTEHDFS